MRPARSWLWIGLALLSACSKEETGPWDGKAVPLEEKGDWVDPGPLAACTLRPEGQATCGSREAFDLSGCDPAPLDRLDLLGVYRGEQRIEAHSTDVSGNPRTLVSMRDFSFQVGANGLLLRRNEGDVAWMQLEARAFLSGQGGDVYVACQAPGKREVRGCFVNCDYQGKPWGFGTFRAERMVWGRGETESSGGLALVSESRVEQGTPVDVYVTKGHAYVVSLKQYGNAQGGLSVFDVSDKAHPVPRKTVTFVDDSYWNGVWAKDDALYVASGATGVIVFDISNPADPVFVRRLPAGADRIDVHTVFVEGNRLYAMSPSPNAETLIFDVSKPLAPKLLNRLRVPGTDFGGYPHDAFAYQGRLYINHMDLGYIVTDVEDPGTASELGRYKYPSARSHANAVGTFAGRTIAFEGGEQLGAHLRVLDVTDPERIIKIGEYRLRNATSIHNMVLVGTRLYIAWYHEGVRVLDVSNPTQPKELAYFNTYNDQDPGRQDRLLEGAIGIRVPGDGHVYVVDTARGLLILNEP